eukprot:tig00000042_g15633.t1
MSGAAFLAPLAAPTAQRPRVQRTTGTTCSRQPAAGPSAAAGSSRRLAPSAFFSGSAGRIQFRARLVQRAAARPAIRCEVEPDAQYEEFYRSLREGGPVQPLNEDGTIDIRMPCSLEEGVFQAKVATQSDILRSAPLQLSPPSPAARALTVSRAPFNEGKLRLQVEIFLPELLNTFGGLKIAIPIVREYARAFEPLGSGLKVMMPDAGAAALARKEWEGDAPFRVAAVGDKLEEEDTALLIVAPDSYQVYEVEEIVNQMCPIDPETKQPLPNARPVIIFNPNLEDLQVVGIGYAARQLRERFLNTFEQAYYVKAVNNYALLKIYPRNWMVHIEEPEDYRLIAEEEKKPASDRIEEILNSAAPGQGRSGGLLSGLSSFFKALSR